MNNQPNALYEVEQIFLNYRKIYFLTVHRVCNEEKIILPNVILRANLKIQ